MVQPRRDPVLYWRFRGHGRKKGLFERICDSTCPAVDVLMMEGTMVGPRSDEAFSTESELEEAFIDVMEESARGPSL